jgi:hypothetical protein
MDDELPEVESLELQEGDVSVVIRADGEIEFLTAYDDENSAEHATALKIIHFLAFALESEECRALFEKSLDKLALN